MTQNSGTNQVIIRRRKRREPQKKGNPIKTFALRFFSLIASILTLYMVVVIYLPWDGIWGRTLGNALLAGIGGAVVIPLLFAAYLLFALATGRPIPSPFRQTGGTFLLFLCGMILTGLMHRSGYSPRPMRPGFLGAAFSAVMIDGIGTLGTLLSGIAFIVLSLFTYGILPKKDGKTSKIKLAMESFIIKIRLLFSRMRRRKIRDDLADEMEKNDEDFVLNSKITETEPCEEEKEATSVVIDDNDAPETVYEDKSADGYDDSATDTDDELNETENMSQGENILAEPEYNPTSTISIVRRPSLHHDLPVAETEIVIEDDIIPEDKISLVLSDEAKMPSEEAFPPSMDLFGPTETGAPRNDPMVLRQKGLDIVTALASFGVDAELAHSVEGPTVIQYQIQLAPGVKVSKVAGLSKDIAVALAVPSLRVEAPIPGTSYVGIEIPNKKRRPVTLRSVMISDEFRNSDVHLPLPLGFRVDGSPMVVGLEELPHLLVAGTTGSGKSVFVTSCITAMCTTRTPSELRFILIDPKRVEMAIYENLPHVLAKPVVDPQKAVHALGWAVREMERRYEVFARAKVRQLSGYNDKVLPKDRLPHIVIVVDELADLMFTASKDVEDFICRLAQMARATGIHLILATQRPSVNVITGLIKANIPARAAFTLPSQTDSRTIIDVTGAQQLLGKGDMLFTSTRHPKPIRIQSPFIDEDRSMQIIDSLRRSFGEPQYVELEDQQNGKGPNGGDLADDDRLEEAIQLVLQSGIASASRLQRQMRIGFTRAARLIDTMEQMGIVGPQEGSKPREIYVDEERAEELIEECFH